jgi:hypothetical protein
MPLPINHSSTLFTTGYKRPSEGRRVAFAFGFYFRLLLEGLLLFALGLFGVGSFWKGKELLKGNC